MSLKTFLKAESSCLVDLTIPNNFRLFGGVGKSIPEDVHKNNLRRPLTARQHTVLHFFIFEGVGYRFCGVSGGAGR